MATDLIRFTQWAREKPQRQYNALMGMLMDPHGLNASFERQAGSKAPGVDGMRKADYAQGLPDRLADLSARLRRLGYRPKPVRRVYIPKANAGRRALGVPTVTANYPGSQRVFGMGRSSTSIPPAERPTFPRS
jgi:RNA-directed DNA polymerase